MAIPAMIGLLAAVAPHIINSFKGGSKSSGGGGNGDVEGYTRVPTGNKEQQNLFSQSAQSMGQLQPGIMQYLQQLFSGDSESGKAFEAPYMRHFNEQVVPGIAERFAGAGALSSSGFQQALGSAGAGLSGHLGMLRENLKSQAVSPIMSMLQNLLGQNTQAFLPNQPSGWENFFSGLAPGIGKGVGQVGTSYLLNKLGGQTAQNPIE